jgi:hypothetical protein
MSDDSMFVHKTCGSRLIADVTGMFRLISPSIGIGNGVFTVGVLELREASDGNGPLSFVCPKCGEIEDNKEVRVHCIVCGEDKPVDVMKSSRQIPSICSECLDYAKGEKEAPLKLRKTLQYINLRGTDMRFFKFSDMLKKPISY